MLCVIWTTADSMYVNARVCVCRSHKSNRLGVCSGQHNLCLSPYILLNYPIDRKCGSLESLRSYIWFITLRHPREDLQLMLFLFGPNSWMVCYKTFIFLCVKTWSHICHWLILACDSEVIRSYEGSAQLLTSFSPYHSYLPNVDLQATANSDNLQIKQLHCPTTVMREPSEELLRYCKTSSISNQTQVLMKE